MGTTRRDTRARLGCKAEGCQPIVVYLPYLAGTADERQYSLARGHFSFASGAADRDGSACRWALAYDSRLGRLGIPD